MSTKCTIGHSDAYHLYEECFDSDNVWLRLDGQDVKAEVEINSKNKLQRVTLGIDVSLWREIVAAWVKSHWGQHPERDYEKEEVDLEAFENTLAQIISARVNSIRIEKVNLPGGKTLVANFPYVLPITESDGRFSVEDPIIGLFDIASSREELQEAVESTLRFMWEGYAVVSPEDLTEDAKKFSAQLRMMFREE